MTAISAYLGLGRQTVRRYVQADVAPTRPSRRTLLRAGAPHTAYLQARWDEGCRDAKALHKELCARGFTGSVRMVQRAVVSWRERPGQSGRQARVAPTAPGQTRARLRPLSARQALWLLLRPPGALTPTEDIMRTRLLDGTPTIGLALAAIAAFRQMVRTRDRAALDPWLDAAQASTVPELRTFAASLRRDYEAIAAALDFPWSSGHVEGQVTKIKLRKREMFGRGSFDLLRRRVLLAS